MYTSSGILPECVLLIPASRSVRMMLVRVLAVLMVALATVAAADDDLPQCQCQCKFLMMFLVTLKTTIDRLYFVKYRLYRKRSIGTYYQFFRNQFSMHGWGCIVLKSIRVISIFFFPHDS